MRRKVVSEEEQRDSGSEQRGDEDDIPLGPQSNISLLDQHQHLKEKAEGKGGAGGGTGWLSGDNKPPHCFLALPQLGRSQPRRNS